MNYMCRTCAKLTNITPISINIYYKYYYFHCGHFAREKIMFESIPSHIPQNPFWVNGLTNSNSQLTMQQNVGLSSLYSGWYTYEK